LVQGLYADRLKRRSEVVKVEVDARGAIVYREVVRRMQEALAQEDYYGGPSDGNFQVETSEALKKFQKAKDLDVSGLPDQKTLHLLLRKSDKQSTH
jgi:peptidoglycan hydrolase-like protein with peptidoglycan-binding domain